MLLLCFRLLLRQFFDALTYIYGVMEVNMTLFKKSKFLLKAKLDKAINNMMSLQDKFSIRLMEYDEAIVKLGEARTALLIAKEKQLSINNQAGTELIAMKLAQVEERIKKLYSLKKELKSKEADYIARVEAATALRDASLLTVNVHGIESIDSFTHECDDMLMRIEKELDTAEFMSTL